MLDTYALRLHSFRSIKDATLRIAPLTVIYGANGSGKSSLIYGLLTLRNFLSNPGLNTPGLFSYPSISLGGLQEVVHDHVANGSLSFSLGVSNPSDYSSAFALGLNHSGAVVRIDLRDAQPSPVTGLPTSLEIPIALPYGVNQQVEHEFKVFLEGERTATLNWNGVTISAQVPDATPAVQALTQQLNERFNLPMEAARATGFVPLRRGFSKPTYGFTAVTPSLTTEDEVASALANPGERFRQYKVSYYLEGIAKRRVQVQSQIGTSTFTIDSIPTGRGIPASIVNEGFGINQLLYLLTICLYPSFKIVAIEEPEIHLHPSMVRELARALVEIATTEDRRLIVSTHSEVFVVALLAQIMAGRAELDDISFVMAENREGESVFNKQEATADGQIQGGLQAFMAAEFEDLALFLGVSD